MNICVFVNLGKGGRVGEEEEKTFGEEEEGKEEKRRHKRMEKETGSDRRRWGKVRGWREKEATPKEGGRGRTGGGL